MKKLMSYAGISTLAIVMSFGLFFTTASAESASVSTNEVDTSDYSPEAWSMTVTEVKRYDWNEPVPNSIPYNKLNYHGNLYLQYIIKDKDNQIKIATYKGTVTCESNCPIPPSAIK